MVTLWSDNIDLTKINYNFGNEFEKYNSFKLKFQKDNKIEKVVIDDADDNEV